ncbi:uracil-DNA glycosylase [Nisaea sp.]|uniref:uracil-DNA glycosylase n=1 Tax=Nisaea sp. TaxID=2024842 RepID=UPI003B51D285
MPSAIASLAEPGRDCPLCPRLVDFRHANREKFPDWHNGPVVSFGPKDAAFLIVGLAPGLRGANRTARPFTGDYAGDLLYQTLGRFGFSSGSYDREGEDDLALVDCRITNAVRCVPPENKPVGAEVKACAPFLQMELAGPRRVVLALGGLAHGAILSALGIPKNRFKFGHNSVHEPGSGFALVNSYHCSRYNTNTGKLTEEMFEDVFRTVRGLLDGD